LRCVEKNGGCGCGVSGESPRETGDKRKVVVGGIAGTKRHKHCAGKKGGAMGRMLELTGKKGGHFGMRKLWSGKELSAEGISFN